jgi:putative Holliday junction resolvase
MRTIAIDLGAKRVGMAISDEGGRFATALEVLTVASPRHARDAVLAVIAREEAQRIVVGVPLNMDDSAGSAARSAVAWGRELAAAAGKPLVLVDERLSSFDAEQSLSARKRGGERLTHRRKKERLDAIAAAGFLQEFLDGRLPALDEDALR